MKGIYFILPTKFTIHFTLYVTQWFTAAARFPVSEYLRESGEGRYLILVRIPKCFETLHLVVGDPMKRS